MEYVLEKVAYFNGQANVVRAIGDCVWNALCDNFTDCKVIRANKALANPDFMRESGLDMYAPRTASNYLQAVLANVAAQEGSSLTKRGKGIYTWVMPD